MWQKKINDTRLIYDEAIIFRWLIDCVSENEIQKQVILDFDRIFERFIIADDNEETLSEIRSMIFGLAKSKHSAPDQILFSFTDLRNRITFSKQNIHL